MKTITDVCKWFDHLCETEYLFIDPDLPFSEYVNLETDEPTFDINRCHELDDKMHLAHTICNNSGYSVYSLAISRNKRLERMCHE